MNILITGKPAWFEKDSHSAISFYRIAYPLKELTRIRNDISIKESTSSYMPDLAGVDVVFIHTPTSHHAIRAIASTKAFGKKLWLDFDDLVFADGIPRANVAWTFFNSEENKKAISLAVNAADVISVSTQIIKDKLIEHFNVKPGIIHVVHNAIPDELWQNRAK